MLTNVAKARIEMLKKVHKNIIKMQDKTSNYINKKRKNAPLLKERNKVYLFAKNLKKKRQKQKIEICENRSIFYQKNQKI